MPLKKYINTAEAAELTGGFLSLLRNSVFISVFCDNNTLVIGE